MVDGGAQGTHERHRRPTRQHARKWLGDTSRALHGHGNPNRAVPGFARQYTLESFGCSCHAR
eukprot:scaffold1500_cov100-Isochrysis_galbana.AAC.6